MYMKTTMPSGSILHCQIVWESGEGIVKTISNHFSTFAINKIDPASLKRKRITQITQKLEL